ncbi:protein toll [Ixodes scapularis]
MCFSGVNSFFVVLIVASVSELCEARNWRRVNTTCPALKQCECSLVVSGANVRCSNFVKMVEWENGTDLKEDMDRLQNTYMRKLTFSGVNVEILPASWFSNLSVAVLVIQHSSLKYIEDTAFNGINRVSKVMLENNMLTTIPRALKSFKALKSLHIPRNLIKTVNDELDSLGELKELNLRSNFIEKIDEDALKNQVHLSKLYLQNNRLEDIPRLLFKNTKHLEHIDLHGNRIKAVGDSIRDMPFLKVR